MEIVFIADQGGFDPDPTIEKRNKYGFNRYEQPYQDPTYKNLPITCAFQYESKLLWTYEYFYSNFGKEILQRKIRS